MIARLREAQHADIPFLREMLYEGVFWRMSVDRPSFEEALACPEVRKELADWGKRAGDTAVVATIDTMPVGAAWYRCSIPARPVHGWVTDCLPQPMAGCPFHC